MPAISWMYGTLNLTQRQSKVLVVADLMNHHVTFVTSSDPPYLIDCVRVAADDALVVHDVDDAADVVVVVVLLVAVLWPVRQHGGRVTHVAKNRELQPLI